MPTARRIQTPQPMPKNSPASMSIGTLPAASATTCRRRRRRPSPRRWSTPPPRAGAATPGTSATGGIMAPRETDGSRPPAGELLYTAKTRSSGGREDGVARSCDGRLDIRLSTPGSARIGTNPEQLLAAGWSACFASAIALAARNRKLALPGDVAIDAEVDLNFGDDGYALAVRLNISVPGVPRDVAQILVAEAREICPYSKATRGNIEVAINLV